MGGRYKWRWQTPHIARVATRLSPAAVARRGGGRTHTADPCRTRFWRHAAILPLRPRWRLGARVARYHGGAAGAGAIAARPPGVESVVGHGKALPAFDLHCPMLSLPLAMGTTLDTIPDAVPYLQPDAVQVAAWGERLAGVGKQLGLRVRPGVVGQSAQAGAGLRAAIDRRRSIDPARLEPLLMCRVCSFIVCKSSERPRPPLRPHRLYGELPDFADTAALVANLDLVISVDTAMVHLTGALGKPVWVLNRFDSCWRWFREAR